MKEVWKVVTGFSGRYEVSNLGNVRSKGASSVAVKSGNRREYKMHLKGKQLKKSNSNGYEVVGLRHKYSVSTYYVHRLVADSFLESRKGNVVNHKDGDKSNNNLNNLEFVTSKENTQHAMSNGLFNPHKGKLDDMELLTALTLLSIGTPQTIIAKHFNVTKATISSFKLGVTYPHIPRL